MYISGPNLFGKKLDTKSSEGPPKTSPCAIPTETGLVISVTGHRPPKLGGYGETPIKLDICNKLSKAFDEMKPKCVITGMALGVDQWVAEICIAKDIPFIAAIPFLDQDKPWPHASKVLYKKLLSQASNQCLVTDQPYANGLLQVRNRWLVDRCHVLLAVYGGTAGGTGNCIAYAQKMGRPIRFIDIDYLPAPILELETNDLKKPSEMNSICTYIEIPKILKAKSKILPKKNSEVIVAGSKGELFAKKQGEDSPYERLVDLE